MFGLRLDTEDLGIKFHKTWISPRPHRQFLCPISMDIMQDPVVVGGSGNTYDRKSIEKHFQHCPLVARFVLLPLPEQPSAGIATGKIPARKMERKKIIEISRPLLII